MSYLPLVDSNGAEIDCLHWLPVDLGGHHEQLDCIAHDHELPCPACEQLVAPKVRWSS